MKNIEHAVGEHHRMAQPRRAARRDDAAQARAIESGPQHEREREEQEHAEQDERPAHLRSLTDKAR